MGRFNFSPAAREEIKVKVGLFGASGGGKTVSSLLLAYGLCGDWRRIAFADTENGSAKQCCGMTYGEGADAVRVPQGEGSFLHCPLGPPYEPQMFADLVEDVSGRRDPDGRPQFDVLIIESLSHSWVGDGGVLERVDQAGKFEGWKTWTPRLRKMVDAIRLSGIHVIYTFRSSTEYVIQTQEKEGGGKKIVGVDKVGVKPMFREGFDYEATVMFAMHADHTARTDKDRTQIFDGRPPRVLTPADGRAMREWAQGAVCQIGSREWVALRAAELAGYAGTLDGLRTVWTSVHGHRARLRDDDYAALLAAKDAAKDRIQTEQQRRRDERPAEAA